MKILIYINQLREVSSFEIDITKIQIVCKVYLAIFGFISVVLNENTFKKIMWNLVLRMYKIVLILPISQNLIFLVLKNCKLLIVLH